jgi:hypothetical protein
VDFNATASPQIREMCALTRIRCAQILLRLQRPLDGSDTAFRMTIPQPSSQLYTGALDFVAVVPDFVPCATSATAASAYEIETSSRFVIDVPRDPDGGGLPSWTHSEVTETATMSPQRVSVSPATVWGDTTLNVDRLAQERCCLPSASCATITMELADAGSTPGCTSMQFTVADQISGAPVPAVIYLAAPTHIALARRGSVGDPPAALWHIHGRYGRVGAVDTDCRPDTPMKMDPHAPEEPSASLWATVLADPEAEYKIFVTFNTSSRGILVGVFTLAPLGTVPAAVLPSNGLAPQPVCDGLSTAMSEPQSEDTKAHGWAAPIVGGLVISVALVILAFHSRATRNPFRKLPQDNLDLRHELVSAEVCRDLES